MPDKLSINIYDMEYGKHMALMQSGAQLAYNYRIGNYKTTRFNDFVLYLTYLTSINATFDVPCYQTIMTYEMQNDQVIHHQETGKT